MENNILRHDEMEGIVRAVTIDGKCDGKALRKLYYWAITQRANNEVLDLILNGSVSITGWTKSKEPLVVPIQWTTKQKETR